nr:MAG TPA_asm: hypothetical protein [Caudoviricetes sp.]
MILFLICSNGLYFPVTYHLDNNRTPIKIQNAYLDWCPFSLSESP